MRTRPSSFLYSIIAQNLVLISSPTGLSSCSVDLQARGASVGRRAGLLATQRLLLLCINLESYQLSLSKLNDPVNRCQHRARDRVSHCSNCIVQLVLTLGPWVPSYLCLYILSQPSGNSETSMIKKEVLVTLYIMQPCSSPLGSTLS